MTVAFDDEARASQFESSPVPCVRDSRRVLVSCTAFLTFLASCLAVAVAVLVSPSTARAQGSGTLYVAGPLSPFNGYVNSTGESVGLVVCAAPRLSFDALLSDPSGCSLSSVLGGGAYGECPSGAAGCWYVIGAWPPVPVASEPPAGGPLGREGEDVQLHIIAMGSAAVALFALGVIGGLQR